LLSYLPKKIFYGIIFTPTIILFFLIFDPIASIVKTYIFDPISTWAGANLN
jgi:hypothetical protein